MSACTGSMPSKKRRQVDLVKDLIALPEWLPAAPIGGLDWSYDESQWCLLEIALPIRPKDQRNRRNAQADRALLRSAWVTT